MEVIGNAQIKAQIKSSAAAATKMLSTNIAKVLWFFLVG